MKQTCLCEYLGVACNHADTFLRIPRSIRHRIYRYAGVPVDTYIAYPNLGPVGMDRHCTTPPEDFDTILNLLNVCQQIREEVEALLLLQNTCVYADDDIDDGLVYLSCISPYLCSTLRDIYVHLLVRPGYFDPPPSTLSWDRIDLWQSAATNILSHASPQKLKLHLICDTKDGRKMAAVLQPLRDFPGVLLELELRLDMDDRDYEKRDETNLAHEIVLRAEGPRPEAPSSPFRFFDLPPELRRNIFEYTRLVAPFRKVDWIPGAGFRPLFIFCECDGGVCLEEDLHYGNRFSRCCAHYASAITQPFCKRNRGSYSSRCKDGLSPLSLLLVSRAMYEEAIAFFYASNRIVVRPHYHIDCVMFAGAEVPELASIQHDAREQSNATDVSDGTAEPNAGEQADAELPHHYAQEESLLTEYFTHDTTKLFVERIGPKMLRLVRTLEIVFPRIGPNSSLSDTDLAYSEWRMAVDYLARLAHHEPRPGLTLIVHIWATPAGRSVGWPLERTAPVIDAHAPRLLKPLCSLSQLDRLFVHLEWPLHWAPQKLHHDIKASQVPKKESPGCGIGLHYIPSSEKDLAEKEVRLEKMVMGAEYDSYSRGKGDELPSPWVRGEWDSFM